MLKKFFLTSTLEEPPAFYQYLLSFGCAACTFNTCVMIEPGKDGTVLSKSGKDSHPLNWSHYRQFAAPTEGERVLILCACCGAANAECLLLRETDGICFILESSIESRYFMVEKIAHA